MPPTTFDEYYEPRPWRCDECRRVLGVVMRDTNHMRLLWVFRVDRADDELPTISLLRNPHRGLFVVHGVGYCKGVECSQCECINEWAGNKQSFDRLMKRYQVKEQV